MREQYRQARIKNTNDMDLIYDIFKEMGGTLDFNRFSLGFNISRNQVILAMDNYFNLTSLHRADGTFIRVI